MRENNNGKIFVEENDTILAYEKTAVSIDRKATILAKKNSGKLVDEKAMTSAENGRGVLADEKGTILIEFIGSFLLFFLLIISILSLVNIVTAQARVHYALTETANTLSMYGYAISAADNASQNDRKTLSDINDTLAKLNKFKSGFTPWENSAPSKALQSITGVALGDVPMATIKNEIKNLILNNLAAGNQSGLAYLSSVRINNLELTAFAPLGSKVSDKESVLWDYRSDIKLTVEYEIDYTFMGLPIPFEPKLKVAQSVMTKMWFQRRGYNG